MHTRVVVSALLVCALAACSGTESPTGPTVPKNIAVAAAIGTDPVSGASIETNQDDYLPGEFVHVVGKGWAPNETVHLFMTESPDTHEDVAMDVTADSAGAFSVHFYDVQQYDLGVTFTMTATGQTSGSRATAVFTDGRAVATVTFNGSATVTVPPGAILTTRVIGSLNGNSQNTLGSLGIVVYADGSSAATGQLTCFDVNPNEGPSVPPNQVAFDHTFSVTAPSVVGAYDVDALAFADDACSDTQGTGTLTKDKAITVAGGNSAPTLASIGDKSVDEGSPLTFTASATDTDTPAQTLTYSLVGAPAGATIDPSTGIFSWTPTDGPAQTATFTVKVTDDGSPAMSDEEEITVTVNNVAPTATFTAPSAVDEGSSIDLELSNPVDPSTVDFASLEYAFDCGDGAGYGALSTTSTASCPTDDNGTRTVKGKIVDKDGGQTEYSKSVTINNVAPVITLPINVPLAPVPAGSPVPISWSFTDPGNDVWTCKISWSLPVSLGAGFAPSGKTCSTNTPTQAGVYTVTVYVEDDDGGSDMVTATAYLVVYDPSAGFVTGGGWINSPAGAYVADASLSGKATFGFVSRYKKGQTTPDGSTEFQFHAAGMNFKSVVYEWLVISGARAQFKGTGTINGVGNYGFLLTAIDGQVNGGGGADKFRIKIWDKNNGDALVYDNNMSAGDTDDPTTLLGGGSINIQAK